MNQEFIRFLDSIGRHDVSFAGGKGANLGEMYRARLPVPEAFVVTTKAYELFAKHNGLEEEIDKILAGVKIDDIERLEESVAKIRKMIESSRMPKEVSDEIDEAYKRLCKLYDAKELAVAVRSSATMEDMREASFAGQQVTILNVRGIDSVKKAIKRCWASVYTARATVYRAKKGFGFHSYPTAVVVQKQIMSEKAGVGFTLHPISGDNTKVVIEGGWGQGEEVVSGRASPDTFVLDKESGRVIEKRIAEKNLMKIASKDGSGLREVKVPKSLRKKPCLSNRELKALWQLAKALEDHYKYPQDFEWAIEKGKVYLVQTRAVTVLAAKKEVSALKGEPILKGLPASPGIASGKVKKVLAIRDLAKIEKGDVLVTKMTTPDFVPSMLKTSAIVTDEGGMTSHAAIVSRELGVPCIVGTSNATKLLNDGMLVTVDGTNGLVYEGMVSYEAVPKVTEQELEQIKKITTRTKIYMNLGVPEKITEYIHIPFDGIGLMRIEFIIASYIGEHPLHLIETGRGDLFVERLANGIATVAKAIFPRPVVVRFSDFKTNEYRELQGGEKYEDIESNPMLGWRGVSRYISPEYIHAFKLEVKAIKRVREEMGLTNVWVMLPFVRTTWEVEKCIKLIEEEGLIRNESFKVWLMAEVPSIIFLADEFSKLCDGFSIGSNDLTQLILGIDRDSGRLGKLGYFDERNDAVKRAVRQLIEHAHKLGKTVSICGQAPSVYPELTEYLVKLGIDSISVNPDTVVKTRRLVYEVERSIGLQA